MTVKQTLLGFFTLGIIACNLTCTDSNLQDNYTNIKIAGAMKNVMWQGELEGIINLDTIKNKKGLYGIGPESYLTGELLINDGQAYVSKVLSDSTMIVEKTFKVSAPFFVYGNVKEWKEVKLPESIKSIKELENFIDKNSKDLQRPFIFKLIGQISNAKIHIQNLPEGTIVSSPEEAHQGQINYKLQNEKVEIIGFFSTQHKGIFTHHDSYLHMHLITKDESKMGHLDKVEFGKMKLYLQAS